MAKDDWQDVTDWEEIPTQDDDWEELTDEVSPQEQYMLPEARDVVLPGASAAGIYGTQKLGGAALKGAAALPEAAQSGAESLAYRAIGGERTAAGKKFLKEQLSELGEKTGAITERDIGKRVLRDKLLGKAGLASSEEMFDKAEKGLLGNIKKSNRLLNTVTAQEDLETLYPRYKELLNLAKKDPTEDVTESLVKKVEDQKDKFTGLKTAPELEGYKRDLQKNINFSDPDLPAKQQLMKAKQRAYREAVENLVREDKGEKGLELFKDIKRGTGERGIIRNILLEESLKGRVAPDISLKDIGTAGVMGTPAAIARRGVMDKGAGIGARALEGIADSKFARGISRGAKGIQDFGESIANIPGVGTAAKGTVKALPFIGAGLTYSQAKADGMSDEDALKATLADEVTDFAGPIKMAFSPGRIGTPGEDQSLIERANLMSAVARREEQGLEVDPLKMIERLSEAREKKVSTDANQLMKESRLDNYRSLIDKLDRKQNPISDIYKQQLIEASEDENERGRVEYNLQQQPAFRRLLNEE